MTELTDVQKFIAEYQSNLVLWGKLKELTSYVITQTNADMIVVKSKYKDASVIGNEAIKQIIIENGFSYIKDVMDTISGFDFQVMVSFVNLIGNLKGTRVGIELVLRLMGFDSIITEWWEETPHGEPWSYKITVIVDSSLVADLAKTLKELKVFSQNYIFAQISNIDLQFSGADFAEQAVVLGGFAFGHWSGDIVEKAFP